ncbi:hypothetical protein A2U01_0110280, partial [Trifolium medium]|nr:hypothetical protein [Trifolium medium]
MQTPSDSENEVEFQASTSLPPRNRRQPQRLDDFVTESDLDGEEFHNLAAYVSNADPKTFDEA